MLYLVELNRQLFCERSLGLHHLSPAARGIRSNLLNILERQRRLAKAARRIDHDDARAPALRYQIAHELAAVHGKTRTHRQRVRPRGSHVLNIRRRVFWQQPFHSLLLRESLAQRTVRGTLPLQAEARKTMSFTVQTRIEQDAPQHLYARLLLSLRSFIRFSN